MVITWIRDRASLLCELQYAAMLELVMPWRIGTGNDGIGRHRWDVWLNWMRRQESYEELKLLEAQWCMAVCWFRKWNAAPERGIGSNAVDKHVTNGGHWLVTGFGTLTVYEGH